MHFFGSRGMGMLILFIAVGAILGGMLGDVFSHASLAGIMPYLVQAHEIFDIQNVSLNLYVVQINFGIHFAPTLLSLLGIMVAVYIFRKL